MSLIRVADPDQDPYGSFELPDPDSDPDPVGQMEKYLQYWSFLICYAF